jgi:hypothetical protein
MLKTVIGLLIWSALVAGCELRSQKMPGEDPKNKTADSAHLGPGAIRLDSSLISLKSFRTVAIEDLLSQSWEMQDADKLHWDLLFWDTAENKRKYPSLHLFRDYSFTENPRCGIKMGKWHVDKVQGLLILNYQDGTKKAYRVERWSVAELVLSAGNVEDPEVIKFSSGAVIHKQLVDDPFYPANNRWRLKPSCGEDEKQLQKRVKACVHFYALFFNDNYRRHEPDISFIGLPSCFVWYNGGISLSPRLELDKKWINCFYSEDQALQGYEILSTLLNKHGLKWPDHADSWVIEIQSVLDQMCNKL